MIEFIKVYNGRLIPRKLIEQTPRGNAEQFYSYLKDAGKFANAFLYGIIDNEHEIKGYIWYQVNMMDMSMFINTLSICDEWKHTDKLSKIVELIKQEASDMNIHKIYFLTDKPTLYEKFGMCKTKEFLLMGEV